MDELDRIETPEFNIFNVREHTEEQELVTVATYLMHKNNIMNNLKIPYEVFTKFMRTIQGGYKNITYHNKTHGADVAQTSYFFMTYGGYRQKAKLDDIDLAAVIIGGACHDHEHPGFNNVYLINNG
jgi:hypothetical protein